MPPYVSGKESNEARAGRHERPAFWSQRTWRIYYALGGSNGSSMEGFGRRKSYDVSYDITIYTKQAFQQYSQTVLHIRSLFLIEQLRRDGKLPAPGELATSLTESEAILHLPCGTPIPQLAFGLYKVPDTKEGEEAIVEAIEAGYRHFDGASFYKNEATFGRALRSSGIARTEFFITGKVWNDAVKSGRHAVRESVETSLVDIGCDYFDLFLVHWPVPGHFCEAYHELEVLHKEGKIKSLGISNFNEKEYEELVRTGICVLPVCNQMEISPVMYRKEMVSFFQQRNILVAAYKPLQRAAAFDRPVILKIAKKHRVTPAQVMLRWGLQKRLIVASKTMHPDRMRENRDVLDFGLTSDDMMRLDALTTDRDLQEREKNDIKEKASL